MNTMLNPNRRPRNKFLAGCLITFTVLGLLASLLAWWFIGRPAQQAWNSFQTLTTSQPLEQQLSNRSSFSAPASNELTEAQVDRFISAQQQMKGVMESNLATLTDRYEELGNREFKLTDLLTLGGAYRDYVQLLSQARDAQVDALNAQGFSAEEYRWVRTEILRASGWQGMGADFEGILGAMQGRSSQSRTIDSSPAPEANVELVRARQSELQDAAALAVLGF